MTLQHRVIICPLPAGVAAEVQRSSILLKWRGLTLRTPWRLEHRTPPHKELSELIMELTVMLSSLYVDPNLRALPRSARRRANKAFHKAVFTR